MKRRDILKSSLLAPFLVGDVFAVKRESVSKCFWEPEIGNVKWQVPAFRSEVIDKSLVSHIAFNRFRYTDRHGCKQFGVAVHVVVDGQVDHILWRCDGAERISRVLAGFKQKT